MLVESERDLQRLTNEFRTLCMREKLKVKVGKSEGMSLRRKSQVTQVADPYRVRTEC